MRAAPQRRLRPCTEKLFCQLGPAAYAVSVAKQCAVRRLQDAAARTPFCGLQAGLLPVVLYRHNSLIRRTLGNTRPELQENKAVNLCPCGPKGKRCAAAPGAGVFLLAHGGQRHGQKGLPRGPHHLRRKGVQRYWRRAVPDDEPYSLDGAAYAPYSDRASPSRPAGSVPGLSPPGALRHRHFRLFIIISTTACATIRIWPFSLWCM